MTDPKEALERLTARAEAPDQQWTRWDYDQDAEVGACGVVVALADLHALISDRDRLEGEVERLSQSPWVTDGGFRDAEDLLDMGRVGRSLMERIDDVRRSPGYEHWMPADDPAEIVCDLLNGLADQQTARQATAALAALRASPISQGDQIAENAKCSDGAAGNNHRALAGEITREHPIAVCIRQAQDDFLKGASSATDDMAMFCARRVAALSSSIQPQGEEQS